MVSGMDPRSLLRRLGHHRRTLAAVATALGVLALVQALTPAPPATTPVVVAATELTGGRTLTEPDLAVVDMPTEIAPDTAAADPAALTGQILTATTPRGVPVTDRSVLTPHTLAPGRSIAPVRFADADLVQVIRAGDHIDIIAAGPDVGPDAVIAEDVRVVTIPDSEADTGFGSASSTQGVLVLVEVHPDEATALAQVTSRAVLSPLLR